MNARYWLNAVRECKHTPWFQKLKNIHVLARKERILVRHFIIQKHCNHVFVDCEEDTGMQYAYFEGIGDVQVYIQMQECKHCYWRIARAKWGKK